IDDKVELIKYHESHPQLGVRKIAEKFSCGRTQVSTIIKNKESILDEWSHAAEEAKLTAKRLGDNEFQGSNGWLEKWRKRYNIKEMRVAGEDGDVNEVTLDSCQERVKELTKGYAPENVWNMDETGQFWKALPDKSLSEAGKRCRGGKKAKQRCT
ncbi:tigger transposable element-derived 6-like, partial [Paramuricea clavata]